MDRGTTLYDHFVRFFREPTTSRAFSLSNHPHSIQILGFDRVFPKCRVHVSLGLSNYADRVGHTAEICSPIEGYEEAFPDVLAACLFRLVDSRMIVGHGVAIPFDDSHPEFARTTQKSALYLAIPYGLPAGFAPVKFADGKGLHIFFALPISHTERKHLVANGTSDFESLLEKAGADLFVPQRASVV